MQMSRHPSPLNSVIGPAGIRVSVCCHPRATDHLFSFPFQLFCGRIKKCTLLWVKICLTVLAFQSNSSEDTGATGTSAVNTKRTVATSSSSYADAVLRGGEAH